MQPFPAEWEAILQRELVFFRVLDPEDQKRFRRELQVFLGEKHITGIKLELDTTTRVLTAASAIIPIFGFPRVGVGPDQRDPGLPRSLRQGLRLRERHPAAHLGHGRHRRAQPADDPLEARPTRRRRRRR